jgi:hypothetical protein
VRGGGRELELLGRWSLGLGKGGGERPIRLDLADIEVVKRRGS